MLRAPEPADAPVPHLLFSDRAVMRHIGDGSIPGAEAIRSFLDRQMSACAAGNPCLLTVVRDGDILGFTGLQPWTHAWGPQGVLEIGWRLGRAHWGHGGMTLSSVGRASAGLRRGRRR